MLELLRKGMEKVVNGGDHRGLHVTLLRPYGLQHATKDEVPLSWLVRSDDGQEFIADGSLLRGPEPPAPALGAA